MLTKMIRIGKKKKKIFLEIGFRAPKNQGAILFPSTGCIGAWFIPKERKKIKKIKLLGSVAASEVPFRVHLAEPDSQG